MFKNTESEDKKRMTALFYSRSKAKTTINKNDIDDVFQSIYTAIIFRKSFLPKKLDHPRKGLINIEKIDYNEWFKWCLVRYVNPAEHHPAIITKIDKYFAKKLEFKDIKFRDVHKIEKKNSINISVFGYENKEKNSIYVSKTFCEEKNVGLLLID